MDFDEFEKMDEFRDKPNNYMVLSIVSTVLGFCSCIGLIIGIIAIVMSSQSSSKFKNGDYEGAIKAAKNAKILGIVALVIFVLHMIYSWYSIQQLGGWDAYIESIKEAIEGAQ